MNEEIQDMIYTELFYKYNDEKHKEDVINKIVKQYYIKSMESENFDIFISFIGKLGYNDYKDMMNRIYNAYKIGKNYNNFILLCKLNYKFIKKEENIFFEKYKLISERLEKLNQELKEEKDKNEKYLKEKMDNENLNKDLKKKLQEEQTKNKQLNENYEKILKEQYKYEKLLNGNKNNIEEKKELYEENDEVNNNLILLYLETFINNKL